MVAIMSGLESEAYDRQYSDKYLAKRLYQYLKPHLRQLIVVTVVLFVVSIVTSLRPLFISIGIDELAASESMNVIVLLTFGLLISALVEFFGNWVRRRLLNRVIGNMVSDMRKDGFDAAVHRDLAFYDKNKSGKVLSRITSDTEEFAQVILLTSDIISQVTQVFVLIGILFWRSIPLTILVLVMTPFIVGTALLFRRLARIATRKGQRATAAVNGNIQEAVSGISVAKNVRQETMIYDEFTEVNSISYQANMRRGLVFAFIFPALNLMAGFATALIVYLGARSVVAGTIAVGSWYLFVQGIDRFWFPFTQLAAFWSQFQQGLGAAERVFALIDTDNTVKQTGDAEAGELDGRIEFKNVVFKYSADSEPVLKDFDLDIASHENIAFVGHTGAGKSTIAKLIARFYEFQGGEILIDGRDIRGFNMQSYRSRLGIVPQEPFLFSGTIADNIRYSKPDATDAEVEAVAYSIGEGEWLDTLPNGLQSDVGERGSRLSMGQRQLISLLRVLLQKPDIFILDEATASIDPFTEMQIQEALDLILECSTSILIAHRLSTVRSADRIIVLRNGGIIEQGDHDALIAQGGHYAELYDTYFRHQSLSYVENARDRLQKQDEPTVLHSLPESMTGD